MVSPPDSTLVAIRKKVRRLTASPSEQSLTTETIDQYINTYYTQDFPYSVKTDQMRTVYTFFTEPYIDKYPIDVNFSQGYRSPFYVDGIQGAFFKDRSQFYSIWPEWTNRYIPSSGDGSTQLYTFTIQGPFLRGQVTIGTVDSSGNPMSVSDIGTGILYLNTPNPQTSNPVVTSTEPGLYNTNLGNPGQKILTPIGSVNYVTGAMSLTFPNPVGANQDIIVRVSQYQTGRPYSCLFYNNYFTIRPVPSEIHRCTIETFMTPVQFLNTTDNPIVNQMWQLIALGSSIKILEDRQDMEGVANLIPLFDRQESLVLERQSTEEIGTRTPTIFSSAPGSSSYGWGFGTYP